MTISEMSLLVQEAIDDDNRKIEYSPHMVYDISIKDLFKAYKIVNNIKFCKVKEFNINTSEKLVEDLNFKPIIKKLKNIDNVVNLLRKVYNRE